jgi:N-methylhydantoinase B
VSVLDDRHVRDLTDEQFRAAYACDRFTASVILSRLRYVMEHMSTGFLREAFSPIVRDWYDFACTLSGPPEADYPMAVVSNSLMVFLGTMPDAVRNTVEEFGPENLAPGDVLICNDAYRVGTHVNDVLLVRPVRPPARHGRDGPGRILDDEGQRLRERSRGPAEPALPG